MLPSDGDENRVDGNEWGMIRPVPKLTAASLGMMKFEAKFQASPGASRSARFVVQKSHDPFRSCFSSTIDVHLAPI